MSIDHHPHRTHQSGPEDQPKSLLDRLRTKTGRRVGAVVGVLAVGAAGFGISKLTSGGGETPQSTYSVPVATPEATLPPSATTPEVSTTPSATETTPAIRYTPENSGQNAILDELAAKGEEGVKEFEAYPLKVRSSWYLSKLGVLAEGSNGQVVYDTRTDALTPLTFAGMNLAEYNPIENEIDGTGGAEYTRNSTPEQVFGLGMLGQNMVGAFQQLDSDGSLAGFNKYYSAMMVTGRVAASPKSKEYQNRTESALNSKVASVQYQDVLDKYRVLHGSTLHPVEIDGETYEGMTITYQSEQGTGTVEKVFLDKSSELGFDKEGRPLGIWEDVKTTLPGEK